MLLHTENPAPTNRLPVRLPSHRTVRRTGLAVLALLATFGFAWPGGVLLRDLADPAFAGPGIPEHAISLHRDLTPRFADWAEERVRTGAAADAPLHDVPTTEWPMFSAVFYLMATVELEHAAARGELDTASGRRDGDDVAPWHYDRRAVDAARDLIVDPVHHTWVRTHWGDDYLHQENVFFRALLIAGLTAHYELTGDPTSEPMLRDQVETLARDLDQSELGVLDDYPGECYPIDVLATVGFIRRADAVLGTDHSAFVARALRAFQGENADRFGLPRFRVDLPSGMEVQPSRGIGTSWSLVFAPELWPRESAEWYRTYEEHFWQDHGWAAGFREYAAISDGGSEPEWTFEIDAGPVFDGFGTAASAFGIAAARRNGRFDHAYTLSTELAGASWTLPDGTMLLPRAISHAADAPYLGESALLYFMTVQPMEGLPIVTGGSIPGSVWFALLLYFGVPALVVVLIVRERRRTDEGSVPGEVLATSTLIALAALGLWLAGHLFMAFLTLALAALTPLAVPRSERPAP